MHAFCQLVYKAGRSSMRYAGKAASLQEILGHTGGETNLFYTLAHIKAEAFPEELGKPWKPTIKDFEYTDYLGFDLDGLQELQDLHDVEDVCERWGAFTPSDERHYVGSGHGVHLLIRIPRQTNPKFFHDYHEQYKQACISLHHALIRANINCKQVDPTVFEASRLLRLPGTINLKEGKSPVPCRWIESLGRNEHT